MRPFTFNPGPKLLAGPDQAQVLADKLPPGPCLLVTDPDLIRLGLPDAYFSAIGQDHGLIVFDSVEADPSKDTLLAATEAGRVGQATSVVGFGGGSPMDVAKLAAYLLGSGDKLDEIWGIGIAQGTRLPLALVPTTAGTGSEATPISVITCEGGVKLAVNSLPLIADWAVLDATLTLDLPQHVTAATGIDAIVHSIEAYTSARLKNPLSDALAREALRLLSGNLLIATREPANLEARAAMLLGAHLAGLAFSNAPVAGV
ncbi:MAG TPA: iron-containing alcohol dehydrogenase, partial [Sphingomicrobium sp.]